MLNSGQEVLQYRLDRQLQQDGTREVWHGVHIETSAQVVIEAFPADAGQFVEAQKQAQLLHGAIVPILAVAQENDLMYVVRPWIEGQTLEAVLAQKPGTPVPFREILSYSFRVLNGLDFAHQKGIVHGQVRASNILIDTESKSHITGFSLAGPQLLTAQDDLHAFGRLLYEMLTGQPPREGPKAPRPVQEVNASVPLVIAEVAMRALSQDPAKRFPDGSTFAKALRDAIEGPPSRTTGIGAARTSSKRLPGWVMVAAAFFALVLFAAVAAWYFRRCCSTPPAAPPEQIESGSAAAGNKPSPTAGTPNADTSRPGTPPPRADDPSKVTEPVKETPTPALEAPPPIEPPSPTLPAPPGALRVVVVCKKCDSLVQRLSALENVSVSERRPDRRLFGIGSKALVNESDTVKVFVRHSAADIARIAKALPDNYERNVTEGEKLFTDKKLDADIVVVAPRTK
jgi:serine/threonine protein kinase